MPTIKIIKTRDGAPLDVVPVTPSDAVNLLDDSGETFEACAIYVEHGGAVRFDTAAGATRTMNMPNDGWIRCRVRRVRATGTTASGLHAYRR